MARVLFSYTRLASTLESNFCVEHFLNQFLTKFDKIDEESWDPVRKSLQIILNMPNRHGNDRLFEKHDKLMLKVMHQNLEVIKEAGE
jgi:hypothetical protein